MKILVINGPNINMLGIREPEIYGKETYFDLISKIMKKGEELKVQIECYQSNHEGDIIDKIQSAYKKFDGIIINPAGYTHTSVAIADSIKAVMLPCVEVHISKVDSREEYRKISYVKEASIATVSGEGTDGYCHALEIICNALEKNEKNS
ncbi:MAG: type II 3-dehydroquinate dehydratase [Clostridia bacterium]|nr:type II 3-dehydroquinate dehydratase [Clostridia bacterium]